MRLQGFLPLAVCSCLVITITYSLGTLAQPFSCPKGCLKYGNCNQETGKCECPFGRRGKTCEEDVLSACRLTPDSPAYCGHVALKPCECVRQCFSYLCHKDWTHYTQCHSMTNFSPARNCFERLKLGKNQTVDMPSKDEPNVVFYRGYTEDYQSNITYEEAMVYIGKEQTWPLEHCPNKCSGRGACMMYTDDLDGQPSCWCNYGYHGRSCQKQRNVCPNKCSGHGKCIDSFCHCEEPYWGIGCARSKAFPRNNTLPNPADFKIYVYDLPVDVAYQESPWEGWEGHHNVYTAYQLFLNQLLNSTVRTEDPSEAHLFFLPALTYAYAGNLGDPEFHLSRVIDYVKDNYPYWNRTGGRDHVLWVPGDRSSCYPRSPETRAPIKLTHFGYFDHADKAANERMVLNDDDTGLLNHYWGCYHPLKDVVMTPYLEEGGTWASEVFKPGYIEDAATLRPTLFFFSGGILEEELEYSGGTRQTFAKYSGSWDKKEMRIVNGYVEDYEQELRTARFCLAPYGHGFGARVVHAMVSGCIPVVIQEHVYQPLEDVLPYEEFSLRFNNADIERLPELLRLVGPDQLAALQRGVQKYWPAFVWHTNEGGRAFEYAMMALRRRYMRNKAMYYGRHQAGLFRRRQLMEGGA